MRGVWLEGGVVGVAKEVLSSSRTVTGSGGKRLIGEWVQY